VRCKDSVISFTSEYTPEMVYSLERGLRTRKKSIVHENNGITTINLKKGTIHIAPVINDEGMEHYAMDILANEKNGGSGIRVLGLWSDEPFQINLLRTEDHDFDFVGLSKLAIEIRNLMYKYGILKKPVCPHCAVLQIVEYISIHNRALTFNQRESLVRAIDDEVVRTVRDDNDGYRTTYIVSTEKVKEQLKELGDGFIFDGEKYRTIVSIDDDEIAFTVDDDFLELVF
jgi:hypothetical protein